MAGGVNQVSAPTKPVLLLRFNVPNAITAARTLATALTAWLLVQGEATEIWLAGVLLIAAWASDGIDGFLARRLGQSTLAGALFDLVADRLLMTSVLIVSVAEGYWWRTSGLMPFNPYPYAAIVIAADLTILVGIFTFAGKRRHRPIDFPSPPKIAKTTYSVQMLTLVVGVLGVGPDQLLAALMYLTMLLTLLASYSYLKKGGYVFTR